MPTDDPIFDAFSEEDEEFDDDGEDDILRF